MAKKIQRHPFTPAQRIELDELKRTIVRQRSYSDGRRRYFGGAPQPAAVDVLVDAITEFYRIPKRNASVSEYERNLLK